MKFRMWFAASLLLAAMLFDVWAETASSDAWARAREAYDAGKYDESYRLYAGLANQPGASAEAQFNAGNAAFRMNDPGHAVVWYRRAERQTPRDPDIRSNLDRALKLGGADPVSASAMDRALRRVSAAEWSLFAVIGWSLAGLGLILWAFVPSRWAVIARRILMAGGLLWLVSIVGSQSWRRADRPSEAVVIERGVRALFAPIAESTVHFGLPPGSIVRVSERSGDWIKVSSLSREGWIPATAIELISTGSIQSEQ